MNSTVQQIEIERERERDHRNNIVIKSVRPHNACVAFCLKKRGCMVNKEDPESRIFVLSCGKYRVTGVRKEGRGGLIPCSYCSRRERGLELLTICLERFDLGRKLDQGILHCLLDIPCRIQSIVAFLSMSFWCHSGACDITLKSYSSYIFKDLFFS